LIRAGLFRYIRRADLSDALRAGWLVVADLGPVHGEYSVLCEWLCDCAAGNIGRTAETVVAATTDQPRK
jgi:hypothetical protein